MVTLCQPCARPVLDLIFEAISARVVLAIEGETLRATGPRSVADLGKELMSRKAEVLAWLSEWQPEAMAALMYDTDTAVAEFGGNGLDEVIQEAAAKCVAARRGLDTLGVIAACQAIQDRVQRLAAKT